MVVDGDSPQGGGYPSYNASNSLPQDGHNPAMAKYFPVQIRPELIVKPDVFTLYFGFLGVWNWKRHVGNALTERVENTWLLTGRAPTQDEMDCMTTLSTQTIYYKRMGLPISSALGTALLYNQARKSPTFPKNPTPANLLARLHQLRLADNTTFYRLLAQSAFKMIFITSLGVMVSNGTALWKEASSMLSDPRMKNFVEEARSQKPEDVRRRKVVAATERYKRTRSGEKDVGREVREEMGQAGSYSQGEQSYGYESASPAVAASESDMAYGTEQADNQGSFDQSYSAPARNQQAYGQPGYGQQTNNQSSQSSSGSDFFFGSNDDDASPTAPEYRNTGMDGVPAGGAWERIRKQNMAQNSPPAVSPSQAPMQWGRSQAQSSPEPVNDSLPSDRDRYDYERKRDKEQAQADFDKMMEAERNASNDGPTRGRGWGS
ncbi:hypothetical protein N7532_005258 [Penicillium argentinense]|uniref:Endo-1,3(4)-beta-glucanase n=1 Tax=Penicillium argentinense TaxID=1131581 RepID=A0A9W9FE62_9EURO|nr:uncharacterized protein N7532_005258 [Penicillium argentinense]KAJ5098257.1 hypothetical protein N7532_005258 [Penicillium argentinense]